MNRKKIAILLVFLIGIGVFSFIKFNNNDAPQDQSIKEAPTTEKKSASSPNIRIVAAGDMLPHETVNQEAKEGDSYNYRKFFDQVEKFFQQSDIRFCNQESPSAEGISVSTYPTFNAPPEFAKDLSKVGCNVISVANNHSNDRGQPGINGTRDLWDSIKPLAIAGSNRNQAEQNKVTIFEVEGVKFAFVAYSEISNNNSLSSYGLNKFDETLVKQQLSEANDSADIVMVSAHWGTEYNEGISANQDKWAKIFADNGADIVFGTGPHVLEPVKKLSKSGGGETIVFFSLGNFLSSQLDIESLVGGLAVIDVDKNSKAVVNIGFLPTYMHYEWTADQKKREDLLARKNLKIYPLDQAADPLKKSQNNTTVSQQTQRVKDILNKYTQINILNSTTF